MTVALLAVRTVAELVSELERSGFEHRTEQVGSWRVRQVAGSLDP
jgi:hypothetical protein